MTLYLVHDDRDQASHESASVHAAQWEYRLTGELRELTAAESAEMDAIFAKADADSLAYRRRVDWLMNERGLAALRKRRAVMEAAGQLSAAG